MKIAISSKGTDLSSDIEPKFGKSKYLLLINTETMQYGVIENPNIDIEFGSGLATAQFITDKGIEVVITGHCGPKAFQTLQAAGINIIMNASGKVIEAITKFKSG